MTDEANAIWIPSPYFFPDRQGHHPSYIVIHGTDGGETAQAIAVWFQNPQSQVAAHYIIGLDGTLVQAVAEKDGAWANGAVTDGCDPWWRNGINPNNVTISIEHVKPHFGNTDQLTPQQQAASFQLIDHLCSRYGIPRRKADEEGGITAHANIDPVDRSECPGPYPWDDLFAFLNRNAQQSPSPQPTSSSSPSSAAPATPTAEVQKAEEPFMLTIEHVAYYYTEVSPTRWRCRQTGYDVADGILAFVKSCPVWLGLPKGPETYPRPNTAEQEFENGVVVWDPKDLLSRPPLKLGDSYLGQVPRTQVQVADPLGEQAKAVLREILQDVKPLEGKL